MRNGPRVGIVLYDRDSRPDVMFAAIVRKLLARGLRVGGLLQEPKDDNRSCCASLYLEDIATGRQVQIFEYRGAETRGCRLDASGLAESAALLREAIEARPDLLFINRFGRQEADGRGLIDEIAAAILAEIPIVVPVSCSLLEEWRGYAGTDGERLDGLDELEAWCVRQVAAEPLAPAGQAHQHECASHDVERVD